MQRLEARKSKLFVRGKVHGRVVKGNLVPSKSDPVGAMRVAVASMLAAARKRAANGET